MGQIQNAFTGAVGGAAIAKIGYDNRIATETAATSRGITQLRKGEDKLQADEIKLDFYKWKGLEKGDLDEHKAAEWQNKLNDRREELINLRKLTLETYEKLPKKAQRIAQIQAAATYSETNMARKLDITEVKK